MAVKAFVGTRYNEIKVTTPPRHIYNGPTASPHHRPHRVPRPPRGRGWTVGGRGWSCPARRPCCACWTGASRTAPSSPRLLRHGWPGPAPPGAQQPGEEVPSERGDPVTTEYERFVACIEGDGPEPAVGARPAHRGRDGSLRGVVPHRAGVCLTMTLFFFFFHPAKQWRGSPPRRSRPTSIPSFRPRTLLAEVEAHARQHRLPIVGLAEGRFRSSWPACTGRAGSWSWGPAPATPPWLAAATAETEATIETIELDPQRQVHRPPHRAQPPRRADHPHRGNARRCSRGSTRGPTT